MYRRILTATFLAGGCLAALAADPAPIIAPRTFNHKTTGSSLGTPVPLYDFAQLSLLMGFQDVWDFDKNHAD